LPRSEEGREKTREAEANSVEFELELAHPAGRAFPSNHIHVQMAEKPMPMNREMCACIAKKAGM